MKLPSPHDAEMVALRRCARDVAALSALPAIWIASDLKRGLQNLADVLAAALRARFVYLRVDGPNFEPAEVVSTDSLQAKSADAGALGRELAAQIDFERFRDVETVSRGNESPFRLAITKVAAADGVRGFIVAAGPQADFPRDTDKLLLSTGAGQIAILIQRSRHENEMAARAAELDRINRELLDAKQRLDATLTAADIGTWTWDVQADRVVGDQNLARLFGMTPAEAQGAPLEVFFNRVHPDDRPGLAQAIKDALATGGAFSAEYRLVPTPEGNRWIVARGRVELNSAGQAVQFPGVALDITARKLAETDLRLTRDAADAANRAKDRFLAVLSHELRTPLSPVLATVSDLAEDPALPAPFRPAIAMIRRNIELETRLIDDLLDVSRVASGKLRLHLQPTRIHEMLEYALETCGGDFSAKNIPVERAFEAPRDLVVGDPARLQQVFWNLLRNAAKFTAVGGRVRLATTCPGPDRIAIHVEDSGVGIPEEALARVFLPFEQGETSVTRQFGGLGLGLAICKAVLEAHGGSIRAESDGIGRGAVFTVELLLTAAPEPIAPAASAPSPSMAQGRNRILLVEDHADTAKSLAWILTKSGYHVTTAFTAASALEAASQQQFDLMASDLGLPDMDGYQLMREMRQRYALKGVALSGFGMDDDISRAHAAGFVAHLVKPVNLARLRSVLQEILSQR